MLNQANSPSNQGTVFSFIHTIKAFIAILITSSLMGVGVSNGLSSKGHKVVLGEFLANFVGDFTEGLKSGSDTSADALSLHHVFLESWKTLDASAWIYEEVNYLKNEEHPFRQLVLNIKKTKPDQLTITQYLISKPLLFKNAFRDPVLLKQLNLDYLADKSACEIIFTFTGDQYSGGTSSAGCGSHFHGAVKYTITSSLNEKEYKTWEKGWDQEGKLVWGRPNSHQFTKVSSSPKVNFPKAFYR